MNTPTDINAQPKKPFTERASRSVRYLMIALMGGTASVFASSVQAQAQSGEIEPYLGSSVDASVVDNDPVTLDELGLTDDGYQWESTDVTWPHGTEQQAPLTTISAAAMSTGEQPEATISYADQAVVDELGLDGVVLEVSADTPGNVAVNLNYRGFSDAYGGGWGSRLQLVELPACAMTDPSDAECSTWESIDSNNNTDQQILSTRISLGEELSNSSGEALTPFETDAQPRPRVFAAVANDGDNENGTGDFSATDLELAGSWTHGGSSGDFNYSYPMRVPPAAGHFPGLALSYSSQSIDGRTSGTNNQASWIGDGWNYSPGYIERSYVSCSNDEDSSSNNDENTGDQCWEGESPSATIALDGINAALVKDDDTGEWHMSADSGWKVEQLGSPASNSSSTNERWKITSTSGIEYHFASEVSDSNSRLTMPVFGNHSGEPCHSSDFDNSSCSQAYRWMLDKVVDLNDNMTRYYYERETGHYGAAADPDNRLSYHRSAHPTRVELGLRADDSSVDPTARILFDTDDRCESNCYDSNDEPNSDNWPDTPWDLHCDAAPCNTQFSPSFFSSQLLSTVTTQVRDGSSYRDVDSWELEHEFKDYGDESQVVLWLNSVQQHGHVSGSESTPAVEFEGRALRNRVQSGSGVPSIWRWRIAGITTETGGIIGVEYNDRDCERNDTPGSDHNNSRLCYPVYWTPAFHSEPIKEYFHKYVVTEIYEQETLADQESTHTYYEYSTSGADTSALWAWDDSEFTDDDNRTYSQWRGYSQVRTIRGLASDGEQIVTRDRYYRGMDGQPLPDNGTRSVSMTEFEGDTFDDHEALNGQLLESLRYDGSDIIEGTVHQYWTDETASRDHDGGTLSAWMSGESQVDTRKRLDGSTWQRTQSSTEYDSRGRIVEVNELGDTSTDADDRCIRTYYTENSDLHLYDMVRRVDKVAVNCDEDATRPDDIISDYRYYFDGNSSMYDEPERGLLTLELVVDGHDGEDSSTIRKEETEYDDIGRPISSTDAHGNTTTTEYTPEGAGPVEEITTTNPLGHETTVEEEPAWGEPLRTIDPNERETNLSYDPLGRLFEAWGPGRDTDEDPTAAFEYDINNDAPSAVRAYGLTPEGEQRLDSVSLYDSLLRNVQTQSPTPNGGRLVDYTAFNTRGEVRYESGPNWVEDSEPNGDLVRVSQGEDHARLIYRYDGAGRVIETEKLSQQETLWTTETMYGGSSDGWMVRTNPPEGSAATAEITNAHGELTEKRTYHGDNAEGSYDSMTYEYDRRGRLETVQDTEGNEWSYEYDVLGRQTAAHDPDAGTTTATYNDLGKLVSTTDARGETNTVVHDELGRTIERWSGDAGEGELQADWTFDTEANGIGLPAESNSYIDGEAIHTRVGAYDDEGRPTRSLVTVPEIEGMEDLAGNYETRQFFLPDGNLSHYILPAMPNMRQEVVLYHYNDLGLVTRIIGDMQTETEADEHYVHHTEYTAWGELAQRVMGRPTSEQVYQTYTFEDGTRRTSEFSVSRDSVDATDVAHLSYEYDETGNVLSISDTVSSAPGEPERQCYVYDHLRRLTDAWAQEETDECATEPSTSDLGGPAAYWHSYEYDALGNRTSKIEHDVDGESSETEYIYPDSGESGPHLLLEARSSSNTDTYEWDESGNLIERTVRGDTETLEWNESGKLASISDSEGETRMVYNEDLERIARIDSTGEATLFVAGHEITSSQLDGVSAVRTYTHGDAVIATRSTSEGLQWLAADHHGTAMWALTGGSLAVTYRRQDPFGNSRDEGQEDWTATQQGFHTGIEDPTGLVQMGARSYDPETGRFISRDPIMMFEDSQQINGYAYANNNPVSKSDPSGLLHDALDPATGCNASYGCSGKPSSGSGGQIGSDILDPATGCHFRDGCGATSGGSASGPGNYQPFHVDTWEELLDHPAVQEAEHYYNDIDLALLSGLQIPSTNMGFAELAWCNSGIPIFSQIDCVRAIGITESAKQHSAEIISENRGWTAGQQNAFRHAYWMASLTIHGFSLDEALSLGVMHEIAGTDNRTKGDNAWGSLDSTIDLINNDAGARIGVDTRGSATGFFGINLSPGENLNTASNILEGMVNSSNGCQGNRRCLNIYSPNP